MKGAGKKVLAFGTFDLFHMGHFYYLKNARALGEHLTVIVARDQNVERLKGWRPWETEDMRLKKVQGCGVVDDARLGYEDWSRHLEVLNDLQPHIICLGFDQKAKLPEGSFEIIRIPPYKPNIYKTSLIKQSIEDAGIIPTRASDSYLAQGMG